MLRHSPCSTLFPYTTLFRSQGEFRDLVRAALLTGCRFGELASLQCRDFNPDAGTVHVRVSKSGKGDRKSTRLNSSHQIISYAVFCLKKKNTKNISPHCTHLE